MAVLVPTASAAERTGARAVALVGGTSSGVPVELYAQDTTSGGLCLDIVVGSTAREDFLCPQPSRRAADDLRPRMLIVGGSTVVYGAVSDSTAELELILYRRRPVRVKTAAGRDYAGMHAGDVRFYAYAMSSRTAIAAMSALDFHDRTRAALDINHLALPPRNGRAVLQRVRDELRKPSELVALDTKLLKPAQFDPDRRVRGVCVGLRRRGALPVAGRAVCTTSSRRLDVRYSADCTTGRAVYYGLAPAPVRSARAVLLDGSTRRVRLLRLPRRLRRSTRAMLLVLPTAGVDRIEALGRRGQTLATIRLAGGAC